MKDARELIRDAWEMFLLYLPLACLGILALTTYWLVRTAPAANHAEPVATQAGHTPDYFMEGFAVKTFDSSGRLRSEVRGERAQHFPDAQWLEIDAIRIRSIDAQGRVTTATANRGLTTDDGAQVQLLGNAVVIREAAPGAVGSAAQRTEYHGEFLHAFMVSEKLRSDQPVEIIHGQDHFKADHLDYDNVEGQLNMDGRVHVMLQPTSTR